MATTMINDYITMARRYPLLDKATEAELIEKKMAGDKQAEEQLVLGNLRLAILIACEFRKSGVAIEELVQAANVGLCLGIQRYEPTHGAKIGYYAAFWIRAECRDLIAKQKHLVRLGTSENQRKLFYKIGRMVQDVCSFDKMKLSEEIGIPVEEIEEFCMRIQPTVSLTTEEGVSDLPDLSPSPEDEAADNELPELLETLIEKADLDESELFVIRNRFKDAPLSLADCAKSLGVSPKAVKGIETRALGYLRETAEAMGIDSFFE